MKKIVFTIVFTAALAFTYGQEINSAKEKFKIVTAGTLQMTPDKVIALSNHVVVSVPNKLEIEADSILIDKRKNSLTAYRTKSFTFNGTVVVGKENNKRCTYHLGEDTLAID